MTPKRMKVGFVSLGCPKNLVDGEVMLGFAREAGHEITPEARDADVIVVNTCAFIDNAKQESIDAILEMAQQKRDGKCSRLVVTGCLAERYREELRKEIPEIDALLGTGELPGIVEALGAEAGVQGPEAGVRSQPLTFHKKARPTYLYDASTPRVLTTPKHFAYVKIAEGCDYTCAFCIIPTLRGEYRSRTRESIVAEARALASQGVKELLLISQDTTFYGIDRQERGALALLLRELNAVDGLEWIRLLYLYPTTITDDVLAAMAECDKVCRYVDLPLQHGSADVLKRMRRPGNRKTYDALLAGSATAFPASHSVRPSSSDSLARPTRNSPNWSRSSRTRGSTTSACSPIRTKKAPARTRCATTCRRRSSGNGASGSWPGSSGSCRSGRHRSWGSKSRCSWTAPRPSTSSSSWADSKDRRPTSIRLFT